jgi:hypothetical protein
MKGKKAVGVLNPFGYFLLDVSMFIAFVNFF